MKINQSTFNNVVLLGAKKTRTKVTNYLLCYLRTTIIQQKVISVKNGEIELSNGKS